MTCSKACPGNVGLPQLSGPLADPKTSIGSVVALGAVLQHVSPPAHRHGQVSPVGSIEGILQAHLSGGIRVGVIW